MTLEALLEIAKEYTMTSDERKEQIRSFTYGNLHLENRFITREHVDSVVAEMVDA